MQQIVVGVAGVALPWATPPEGLHDGCVTTFNDAVTPWVPDWGFSQTFNGKVAVEELQLPAVSTLYMVNVPPHDPVPGVGMHEHVEHDRPSANPA